MGSPLVSRVFIVEDHALVRDGLRALLQGAGHEVAGEADHPSQAVPEIIHSEPDVVLLDLNLGGRSGLEVLPALQQRGGTARTIVLSMSAQPRHVAEALRLGAAGYVLKDSPASELLRAIETVVGGRRYLSSEIADLAVQALTSTPVHDRLGGLSPRERQVVLLVAKGRSSTQIAQELCLSPKTVDTYRFRLMQKLGVSDLPALVRLAIRERLIDLDED